MNTYAFLPVTVDGATDYAWVDADVAEELGRYHWHTSGGQYATTTTLGLMHRYLMGLAKGDPLVVHHINEDTLDNRRENLQVVERDLHGRLPHPRRDALSRSINTGTELILPRHLRRRVLIDESLERLAA